MISENLLSFCNQLTQHTDENTLYWNVINADSLRTAGFPDVIRRFSERVLDNEFSHVLLNNSFYCLHKDGLIALFRIDMESGRDGSHRDHFVLAIQIQKNSMVFFYEDPYLQEPCNKLHNAILNAINAHISLPDDLYEFMCFD